jgi:hypothetical protein
MFVYPDQPLARKNIFTKSTPTYGALTRLQTNLFKTIGDQIAESGRIMSATIEEFLGGAHRRSIMVEK